MDFQVFDILINLNIPNLVSLDKDKLGASFFYPLFHSMKYNSISIAHTSWSTICILTTVIFTKLDCTSRLVDQLKLFGFGGVGVILKYQPAPQCL